MKNAFIRVALPILFTLPSVMLNATKLPGLKCPTDAKGGKRASVQTTHIRKKLVKQKHNAVKTQKVKVAKVHKKISIKLPKVNLPDIHLKLPGIHIPNPFRAKPVLTGYHTTGKQRSKSRGRKVLSKF